MLPLLHERITSFDSPLSKAAEQLKTVCAHLEHRPLSIWDSEYGCARFIQLTAQIACDKLLRLRSNRVLYGPPPAYSGRGRPRKHGDKFKLNTPETWWPPHEQQDVHDEKLGHLRLRWWKQLHFYKTPEHPMQLVLLERINVETQRTHRPLWLIDAAPDSALATVLKALLCGPLVSLYQATTPLVSTPSGNGNTNR